MVRGGSFCCLREHVPRPFARVHRCTRAVKSKNGHGHHTPSNPRSTFLTLPPRCEQNNLYKGYGINGQKAPTQPGGLGCIVLNAEWCVGVTCKTAEVEDKTACTRCAEGYEFEAETTYKYHDRVISNLCLSTSDGTSSTWLYVLFGTDGPALPFILCTPHELRFHLNE